jgi:gas vesicle protein
MEKTNTGKIIGALVLGIAIGGVLGVLFAPDKGSETRKKLSVKGDDLADGIKEKLDELLNEVKAEAESVKTKAASFAEDAGAAVSENLRSK